MKPLEPLIPGEQAPPEFKLRSIVLAAILAVVFGAASGYLGLRIGMTFAASIPAAVMSLAILRGVFHDSNVLESNMVQTMASAGESLMGGVVFMVPALFFMSLSPPLIQISMMALAGGLLGVFLLIPLRNYLIVREHESLPYPEGIACANILKLGDRSQEQARYVFLGMGVGAFLNFVNDGLGLLSGKIELVSRRLGNLTLGMDVTPLMLGVGFLVGPLVGITMFGGSLLRGAVMVPAMNWYYGSDPTVDIDQAVRMVGAGAVATGGLISILKMAPMMSSSLGSSLGALGETTSTTVPRIHRNLSKRWIVLGTAVALAVALMSLALGAPGIGPGYLALAALLILTLAFVFVALCARLVGFMGTSGYPLSGQTIGALLATVACLKLTGLSGPTGMAAAIVIGAVICIAIAVTADISQDLKTGALLGATPFRQQIGEIVGVVVTSLVAGGVILLFHAEGTLYELPAPQARLMAAIVESVMAGEFQWLFVGIGVAIALGAELCRISSIMVAVGIYLPPYISSGFLIGGLLRGWFERTIPDSPEKDLAEKKGTVLASGLIAGWALTGVLVVGLIALGVDLTVLGPETQEAWHGHWGEALVNVGLYGVVALGLCRVLGLR